MTRFALAALALLSFAARAAADRPNMVFILADDLGREDCGFMGGTQIRLKSDPYETRNLADHEPRKVEELRRTLASFARQAAPPKARPRPEGFVAPRVWGEVD